MGKLCSVENLIYTWNDILVTDEERRDVFCYHFNDKFPHFKITEVLFRYRKSSKDNGKGPQIRIPG